MNRFTGLILLTIVTIVLGSGCKKDDVTPPNVPPTKVPTIPNPPNLPTVISSVADIKSGTISKGTEVFLYGYLTRQKNNDEDDWYFTDDGGSTEVILDFPTSQVPQLNKKMLVYGGVEDIGEVDVISWFLTDTKPPTPTPPTFPPAGVTPPELAISTVDQIVKGVKSGEVYLAGQLTHSQDDDCDEWVFNDGTGSLEVEFPSCHVPAIGVKIYIYGKTDGRYEVDVFSWQPQ